MSVGLNRKTKGASKTEISELNVLSSRVDKQVLWFQITMENSVLVQVNQSLQDLIEEALCLFLGQWLITMLFHVLLQVEF